MKETVHTALSVSYTETFIFRMDLTSIIFECNEQQVIFSQEVNGVIYINFPYIFTYILTYIFT